jgi:hypothetical protein
VTVVVVDSAMVMAVRRLNDLMVTFFGVASSSSSSKRSRRVAGDDSL